MYTINRKSNFGGTEQVKAVMHNIIHICFFYFQQCLHITKPALNTVGL
jgi:hypothetical protein